jgi:hypothetical protein
MTEKPGVKQLEQFEQLFSNCRKRLEEVQATFEFGSDVSQYFSETIFKTLLVLVSPRPRKPVTREYGA